MLLGKTRILCFTSVWEIIPIIFVLVVIRASIVKQKNVASAKCGIKVKDSLRVQMLNKLFALGPAYTATKRTGNIGTMFVSKIEWLKNYYSIYAPAAVATFVNSLLLIIVIACFDVPTALVCVVAFVGLFFCPMTFYKIMKERGDAEWEANSQYYSDCLDSIQGLTTLKAFNADEKQRQKMHCAGENLRQKVMSLLKITMIETGVLEFLVRLGSAASIVVAVSRFLDGYIEPDGLIYTLFLVTACFVPMLTLSNSWHIGYKGVTGAYSLRAFLDEPQKRSLNSADIGEQSAFSAEFTGSIVFDHVSFSYDKKEGDVLKNVSFEIPNKSMMALVGSSGSGKSTIAHLLAGFYPAESGVIRVGNMELTRENISPIRDLISAVWQDNHIFYGTVYDNILIGKPEATMDEVIAAAKESNIHDFIQSLPEGYNTLLGEQGVRFSGGERQRIALARAFLRDAPIVIFDEATSSLDRRNEIEIQKSLKMLREEKTVLVIAHRLETIRDADRICIMDAGEVKACGTHEELLHSSALYNRLVGYQLA